MVYKTVSLSVRVSDSDAEFLAGLKVDGAITPSEKLRAILHDAKKRHESIGNYNDSLLIFKQLLEPALEKLREHELNSSERSELLQFASGWLPETLAFMSSALLQDSELKNDSWSDVEQGVADRFFSATQMLLRMGITSQCTGYDPGVVRKKLPPLLDLAQVIIENLKKDRKE